MFGKDNNKDFTDDWKQYLQGQEYKSKIGLYQTVDKNERFYSGDQWNGVNSNGLPTPVINVIKRIMQYKISTIMSSNVKINYDAEGLHDDESDEQKMQIKDTMMMFSDYADEQWEKLKMNSSNEKILLDAGLSGDGLTYYYFDADKRIGQEDVTGDIAKEEIDNVNYFPSDTSDWRVQSQESIIIAFRKPLSKVMKEAKNNGISKVDIDNISADDTGDKQAGDLAKQGLTENKMVTVLLKMWKDSNGFINYRKSVKHVIIKKDTLTNQKRYPLAKMTWDFRKNSCHGESEVKSAINNQIAINKVASMIQIYIMLMSFPKIIYDNTLIDSVSNQIGGAIGINGSNGNVNGAINYLNPPSANFDAFRYLELLINLTKSMHGASDGALGEIKADNTSAIIQIREASAVPLESVKRRFYQYVEDIGLIWIDMWLSDYYASPRNFIINKNDKKISHNYSSEGLRDIIPCVKIDVGASNQWSEIANVQTLDNLLDRQLIDFKQYLDRLPKGYLAKKQELIEEINMQEEQQEEKYEGMAQFMESMPVEIQEMIQRLPQEEQEPMIQSMMQMPPSQLEEHIAQLIMQQQ